MKCGFCDYEWKERVENPKECPKCKRRFDREDNYVVALQGDAR